MLGKLAISIGGGVLTYYYIASSMGGFTTDEYVAATDDTKKLLSSEIVPAAIAFLLCFATSSIFFYSYQMAIGSPARRLVAQPTRPAPPATPSRPSCPTAARELTFSCVSFSVLHSRLEERKLSLDKILTISKITPTTPRLTAARPNFILVLVYTAWT